MPPKPPKYQLLRWEFTLSADGAAEIHTPVCVDNCDTLIHSIEVDVESAVGNPRATLLMHWDDTDLHIFLDGWEIVSPDYHHKHVPGHPLPMVEGSSVHLFLSNVGSGTYASITMLIENVH